MQNSSHAVRRGFGDHCASVVLCIASVDDDGLSCFMSELERPGKGTPLLEARRIIVMVVEPALTDRTGAV